jgi:ribosomal protein S27E
MGLGIPRKGAAMTPHFNIGDTVWRATYGSKTRHIECPDCGGTGRLRVTFHDETTVSIDCATCAAGYEPPTGRVTTYDFAPEVSRHTVAGIEMDREQVRYRLSHPSYGSYWSADACDVFATEDAAKLRGVELAKLAAIDEEIRLAGKEKPTRTWAWNASYHRRCIKDAQKQLDYHTRKLQAANLKVKKEKEPT